MRCDDKKNEQAQIVFLMYSKPVSQSDGCSFECRFEALVQQLTNIPDTLSVITGRSVDAMYNERFPVTVRRTCSTLKQCLRFS